MTGQYSPVWPCPDCHHSAEDLTAEWWQEGQIQKRKHSPKAAPLFECNNKTRYLSRRAALTGKRILKEKGENVHPYHCSACGGWHVGHRI